MGEELLSKEELELLMDTLEKKKEEHAEGVKSFDFSKLEKVDPHRYIRLDQFLEEFRKKLRENLKTHVITLESVNIKEKAVKKGSQVFAQLKPPLLLLELKIGTEGSAYILTDSSTAYKLISLTLGGQPAELEGKPFSRLELSILQKIFSEVGETFKKLWEELVEIPVENYTIKDTIMDLDLDDEYYTVSATLTLGEEKGSLTLLFPLYLLKSLRETLSIPKLDPKEQEKLLQVILSIPITLEAVIYKDKQVLKKLLSVEKENTLLLKPLTDENAELLIGKTPKFKGTLGELNGKRAVKITKIL
ncbi:FliM/FliN family flagellar motor switch protein [Aquifex sp.]